MPVTGVRRGEVYSVSLDSSMGHEQKGKRPVLVVSPDGFNAITGTPIVVPITTGGDFARTRGFAVSLQAAGTKTTGVIRCDQPRPVDLAAREARLLESVPDTILEDVLARLATIFT